MSRTWHKKREENYRGSRRFDRSCRCHGGCPYCEDNRMHTIRMAVPADEQEQIEEGYDVADGT